MKKTGVNLLAGRALMRHMHPFIASELEEKFNLDSALRYGMIHSVPIFTRRAKRAVTQHPKFYFYDTGIYNILRPSGPLDRPEDIRPLKTFGDDYPEAKRFFVYRGREKLKREGILIMPCTEFLMTLS